MGKELELYQQEIDKAYKPILERLEHYKKGANKIRSLLKDYFFNENRISKLKQENNDYQLKFDFDSVKGAMERCLLDEEALKIPKGLIQYFDTEISECGLPLERQDDHCLYLFKPSKPYTPEAQKFMEQFGYALSAYRACLGVYEVYFAITYFKAQQAEELKIYMDVINYHLESTQGLKPLCAESDLIALLKQANHSQDVIQNMLRTEKVQEGMDKFKEELNGCSTALNQLLDTSANNLEKGYIQFPNDALLLILHDRTWHWLLKCVSQHLYLNQYTYSTYNKTLHIKRECIDKAKSEIDTFITAISEKTPLLKITLLKNAAKCISEIKIDILASIAEKGIILVEAPKIGLFSSTKPDNFYERMFDRNKGNSDFIEQEDSTALGI